MLISQWFKSTWSTAGLALMLVASANADEGNNAQKAMAKAQFLLRQATAEKTTLQQQVGDLQKQVDALTKQLGDLKSSSAAKQESIAQQMAGNSEKWRSANEKQADELKAAHAEIKASNAKVATLEQSLKAQTDNFSVCYANNKKLYEINKDILGKYKDKGAMDAILQREPFTGVSEVEVENLIQDYQYKLDDLVLPSAPAAASKNSTGS